MTTSIDTNVNAKRDSSSSTTAVTTIAPNHSTASHDQPRHLSDQNSSHDTHKKIRNAPYNHEPQILEGCDTLSKLWRQVCLARGDKIAHREKAFG
ncbi:long-chain fatty acid--CoA ligase, partial [Psychrobacter sp. T6-1]